MTLDGLGQTLARTCTGVGKSKGRKRVEIGVARYVFSRCFVRVKSDFDRDNFPPIPIPHPPCGSFTNKPGNRGGGDWSGMGREVGRILSLSLSLPPPPRGPSAANVHRQSPIANRQSPVSRARIRAVNRLYSAPSEGLGAEQACSPGQGGKRLVQAGARGRDLALVGTVAGAVAILCWPLPRSWVEALLGRLGAGRAGSGCLVGPTSGPSCSRDLLCRAGRFEAVPRSSRWLLPISWDTRDSRIALMPQLQSSALGTAPSQSTCISAALQTSSPTHPPPRPRTPRPRSPPLIRPNTRFSCSVTRCPVGRISHSLSLSPRISHTAVPVALLHVGVAVLEDEGQAVEVAVELRTVDGEGGQTAQVT
jgi:hypothetical protein